MKYMKRIIIIIVILALGGVYSYGTWEREIYNTDVDSNNYKNAGELRDGMQVEQGFNCPDNGLTSIKLKMSNLDQECKGIYEWTIIEDKTETVVGAGTLKAEDVDNAKPYEFKFQKILKSQKVDYTFLLKTKSLTSEHGITVMMTEKGEMAEKCEIDGKRSEGAMVLSQQIKRFNWETYVVFLGFMIYMAFFIKLLLKLFK